jgi:hypothetical protein
MTMRPVIYYDRASMRWQLDPIPGARVHEFRSIAGLEAWCRAQVNRQRYDDRMRARDEAALRWLEEER